MARSAFLTFPQVHQDQPIFHQHHLTQTAESSESESTATLGPVAKKLSTGQKAEVETMIEERISSLMASALADPDVDEHAKSLAGYVLQKATSGEEKSSTEEGMR